MVGYGVSILFLIIFIFSVLLSKYLWDMFHIIGMNFAFALMSANGFMIASEFPTIRIWRDYCTLIGFGINLFYVATASLLLFLAFSGNKNFCPQTIRPENSPRHFAPLNYCIRNFCPSFWI